MNRFELITKDNPHQDVNDLKKERLQQSFKILERKFTEAANRLNIYHKHIEYPVNNYYYFCISNGDIYFRPKKNKYNTRLMFSAVVDNYTELAVDLLIFYELILEMCESRIKWTETAISKLVDHE